MRPGAILARVRTIACVGALIALCACSAVDNRSVEMTEETVLPVTGGEAADVPASVLADSMLRAGFTSEEILHYGPKLHTALATSGSAQVRQARVVAAIFAIHNNKLYVTSRERGTFMTDLGAVPADPAEPAAEPDAAM